MFNYPDSRQNDLRDGFIQEGRFFVFTAQNGSQKGVCIVILSSAHTCISFTCRVL